ncbi:phosphatase PAP2 family protein [Vibrio sp. AK197]
MRKLNIINKKVELSLLTAMALVLAPFARSLPVTDLLGSVDATSGWIISTITDSAGQRGLWLTIVILSALSLYKQPLNRTEIFKYIVQFTVIFMIAYFGKNVLKELLESPRPYTELLTHELLLPNPGHFYKLGSSQQLATLDQVVDKVSEWRLRHWYQEMNYSLPSGHTVFAALCLAFFGAIFVRQQRFILASVVVLWATLAAYSRIWLGMHRPEDLYAGIVFVAAVVTFTPNVGEWLVAKMPGHVKQQWLKASH